MSGQTGRLRGFGEQAPGEEEKGGQLQREEEASIGDLPYVQQESVQEPSRQGVQVCLGKDTETCVQQVYGRGQDLHERPAEDGSPVILSSKSSM